MLKVEEKCEVGLLISLSKRMAEQGLGGIVREQRLLRVMKERKL